MTDLGVLRIYCNSCRETIVELPLNEENIQSSRQYVNMLCPLCHKAILITQEEYDYTLMQFEFCNNRFVRAIDSVFRKLFRLRGTVRVDTEPIRFGAKPEITRGPDIDQLTSK